MATNKTAVVAKVEEHTGVLSEVKTYARKAWLVGLGAYSRVGAESSEYFKALVKEGEALQTQRKKRVDASVDAANTPFESQINSVKGSVAQVKGKVELQLDKIEKAFDSRVAAALARLGMPSRQDVELLSAKIDALNELLVRVGRTQ